MKKYIIIAVLVILGIYAYSKFTNKSDEIVYMTQIAKKGTLAKKVEATGEIFATELVDVGAQVGGQIKKLYVKLGDKVKKGDMIAEIDSQTRQNDVDNKSAQLEIYKAKLESAKVALDIAKTQFEREDKLYKNNATSKKEYESAKNAYTNAKTQIKELNAQLHQAEILLSTAKIDLGYTKILAPSDGTVVSIQVEEGQTVNANQTTPTIVNIADLSKVKLKMQIAEGDITKIAIGTPVEYTILSEPDRIFKTKVDFIDPGLTTLSDGSYQSKTQNSSTSSSSAVYYYAQSIVDNVDEILRIGMTTQNSLLISEVKDSIIISALAIKKRDGKSFVRVLNADKSVSEREVKVGISDNLQTQIISGINEGDKVITSESSSKEIAKMIAKENRGPR
ncbi:MAG: efflux RND transporter periplasmic adaptor subunit [Campylobacter sp.]|nr:efflux RND transporter periplasmic adaptor subunit [Campylobacter sp.]